jgi:hypothetical protein
VEENQVAIPSVNQGLEEKKVLSKVAAEGTLPALRR